MDRDAIEALYMTYEEVMAYLNVTKRRVYQLRDSGMILALKGGVYGAQSVHKYRGRRGNKQGGPYPKGV